LFSIAITNDLRLGETYKVNYLTYCSGYSRPWSQHLLSSGEGLMADGLIVVGVCEGGECCVQKKPVTKGGLGNDPFL
jgi:hypothetical protein